jgi:hypothetical protein
VGTAGAPQSSSEVSRQEYIAKQVFVDTKYGNNCLQSRIFRLQISQIILLGAWMDTTLLVVHVFGEYFC